MAAIYVAPNSFDIPFSCIFEQCVKYANCLRYFCDFFAVKVYTELGRYADYLTI